jgi:hypothetical protein
MAEITIHDILAQFRDEALSIRDLGDRYLLFDSLFAYHLFSSDSQFHTMT